MRNELLKKSIFSIGIVSSVDGKNIKIRVDKDKNLPHLFFYGKLVKNVSVGLSNYVKILKGFTEIICKVEGEYINEDKIHTSKEYASEKQKINRYLNVTIFGFYDYNHRFQHGIKEMPLIGSECELLSKEEFEKLHKLSSENELTIKLGVLSDEETQQINLSANKLFTGHIGIFGNTGSGKSNTLAKMYAELFKLENFIENSAKKSKFIFIDFNSEYSGEKTLTVNKRVYKLSTNRPLEDHYSYSKVPIAENSFIDIELLTILSNATEKTQKPFLNRAINLYKKISKEKDGLEYFKNNLRQLVLRILKLKEKNLAFLCIDRYKQILKIDDDIIIPEWHNKYSYFQCGGDTEYESITDEQYKSQSIYINANDYNFPSNVIDKFLDFLKLQLLYDLLDNRVQNDHIYPCIARLESIKRDIQKVFTTDVNISDDIFKDDNIVVIDMKLTNQSIKKTLPLIILKKQYEEHRDKYNKDSSLHIVIDEAHNILSENSVRESETWKDYRLETFEEIVKEGRKFGVFLTVASQRPSDISSTIISQLHNYFIHKLMNENDLKAINRAVSYLDKLSFDSIANLSVGCCFIAGQLTQFPLSVKVLLLDKEQRPQSETVNLDELWKSDEMGELPF
ncbi:MAG: ATP-binding protein [Fibromonadaceae bacterium]|jgi:DNA helicase HerA-like ATPase|nr:ATP-binding protein [Fibromonadaceae bacterium]